MFVDESCYYRIRHFSIYIEHHLIEFLFDRLIPEDAIWSFEANDIRPVKIQWGVWIVVENGGLDRIELGLKDISRVVDAHYDARQAKISVFVFV